jgi:hypothetical protein
MSFQADLKVGPYVPLTVYVPVTVGRYRRR